MKNVRVNKNMYYIGIQILSLSNKNLHSVAVFDINNDSEQEEVKDNSTTEGATEANPMTENISNVKNKALITSLNGKVTENGSYYVYTQKMLFCIRHETTEKEKKQSYSPQLIPIGFTHMNTIIKMWWFSCKNKTYGVFLDDKGTFNLT